MFCRTLVSDCGYNFQSLSEIIKNLFETFCFTEHAERGLMKGQGEYIKPHRASSGLEHTRTRTHVGEHVNVIDHAQEAI